MENATNAMLSKTAATSAQMPIHARVALQMQVIFLTRAARDAFVMSLKDLHGTLRS